MDERLFIWEGTRLLIMISTIKIDPVTREREHTIRIELPKIKP